MKFQLVGLSKGFIAYVADTWLDLRVRSPYVAVVGGMRCKRLTAVLAFERPLAAVLSQMSAQYRRSGERFDAVRTLVWPFPAVHPLVLA